MMSSAACSYQLAQHFLLLLLLTPVVVAAAGAAPAPAVEVLLTGEHGPMEPASRGEKLRHRSRKRDK